jgi:hypothetical protein
VSHACVRDGQLCSSLWVELANSRRNYRWPRPSMLLFLHLTGPGSQRSSLQVPEELAEGTAVQSKRSALTLRPVLAFGATQHPSAEACKGQLSFENRMSIVSGPCLGSMQGWPLREPLWRGVEGEWGCALHFYGPQLHSFYPSPTRLWDRTVSLLFCKHV